MNNFTAAALMSLLMAPVSVAQPLEYEVLATTGEAVPGAPFGWTFSEIEQPFLDNLGRVTFLTHSASGEAVYRTSVADPGFLVRTGETPPGYGVEDFITTIRSLDYVNSQGTLGLEAWIAFGDGSPTLLGTWTHSEDFGLHGVSFGGRRGPGTMGIMCSGQSTWYQYWMSNAGHFAISNRLCGANSTDYELTWASEADGENLALVSTGKGPVPLIQFAGYNFMYPPVGINSQGTLVYEAFIQGTNITTGNNHLFYAWNAQDGFSIVAREGDPVPGFPPTVTYDILYDARINDLGHTMISCKVKGPGITEETDHVILSDRDGNGLEHVYREGIQAPGFTPGVKITRISNRERVHFNNKSQIAFMGHVTGASAPSGDEEYYWAEVGSSGLKLVAHTGQVVPGFDEPHVLTDFVSFIQGTGEGPEPVFTDSGRLAFWGQVEGPVPGGTDRYNRYYITDAAGELRVLLPAGTQLDVSSEPGPPDIRTVESSSFRLSGSANDADQVAALVEFTDGSSAAVLVSYGEACLADVNGDGAVSPADFSAWVAAYNAQAPGCDQNEDGQCTAADFSAWVTNYNSGC